MEPVPHQTEPTDENGEMDVAPSGPGRASLVAALLASLVAGMACLFLFGFLGHSLHGIRIVGLPLSGLLFGLAVVATFAATLVAFLRRPTQGAW